MEHENNILLMAMDQVSIGQQHEKNIKVLDLTKPNSRFGGTRIKDAPAHPSNLESSWS
jgi:hypothetical protein